MRVSLRDEETSGCKVYMTIMWKSILCAVSDGLMLCLLLLYGGKLENRYIQCAADDLLYECVLYM